MRATPYAIPFRQPVLIAGTAVPAHRGLLVEHRDGVGAATVWPGAAEDWSRPAARAAAVETAQLDGLARAAGVPLAALLGGVRRRRIALNALLLEREPAACAAAARRAVANGFRCLKLKLAPGDLAAE
ncbi:MAG: hypothetical protein SF182_12280, partial [Deltaproteobacteria bacterium]|nr:hypothetical protein [Deltaproteobacteria bacterium]